MDSAYDWEKAHFSIACLGMADAWMGPFFADDGAWAIAHPRPSGALVPFRADHGDPASHAEVLRMANCISFDHDMPTVVRPRARDARPPIEPIAAIGGPHAGLWYFDALQEALGLAHGIRVEEPLELRYEEYPDGSGLTSFSKRFERAGEGLSLYAMATRQIDWMAEYLNLYRVIEWAGGMPYIADRLDQVATYDFGCLMARRPPRPAVDVFETYRDMAMGRIDALRSHGHSNEEIATHLYGVRNALAHGRSNFLLTDSGEDVLSVATDLPVLKLLARIVIEDAQNG